MVKVTYLYHSGFAVELSEHVLVFDYYKGRLPEIPHGKKLLLFASHKHPDHFQLSAVKWAGEQEQAWIFLGKDIRLNENYLERKGIPAQILKKVTRLHDDELMEVPEAGVTVRALRSTDQGAAFVVQTEGICIYHAGDLNHWYWSEESESWNAQMEKDYKEQIDKLSKRHFQLAFVPLDPRLKEGYRLGLDYFLQKAEADAVFPMHMWEDYAVIRRYKQTETGKRFAPVIQEIKEPGQVFEFKNF
ncbi:MAG: MBL fold metallo-hydrolase [Lachnospiraceae bacterium]|nr:MBL fold metallo-hydrolase [Lachnospiraceae bacterium]